MTKKVTIYLGPAIGLTNRRLQIRRMHRATDMLVTPALTYNGNLTGTDESVTITLADNVLWQAALKDYKTTGEVSRVDVLNFHTGSLQFPGPRSNDRLRIYSMEDVSSTSSASSSVSSSSISASASSVSTSSSSSSKSSSSKSSKSSQSVSASSISTSSASSASSNSSSSSKSSKSSKSTSSVSSASSSSDL